jgi:hypothetical protein
MEGMKHNITDRKMPYTEFAEIAPTGSGQVPDTERKKAAR